MFFTRFPKLTVDVIIPDLAGRVILLARGHEPFEGKWSFPGGMVDSGESVMHAAVREVREELGIEVLLDRVFAIRSLPGRDPRGHFISIVFIAYPTDAEPQRTEEATAITRIDRSTPQVMAFDHAEILQAYWEHRDAPGKVIAD